MKNQEEKALAKLVSGWIEKDQLSEGMLTEAFEAAPSLREHQFKIGAWYKADYYRTEYIAKVLEVSYDEFGKGTIQMVVNCIRSTSEYENSVSWINTNLSKSLTPMSKEEILKALKKVAIKRGFEKGVVYSDKSLGYNNHRNLIEGNNFEYISHSDTLLIDNWAIYENGAWAEILKTITKEEAEKLIGRVII